MTERGVVFDSSAVLSMLREEAGHRRLHSSLEVAEVLVIGAPTGKGRHPASLNFGDCMTYASARLAEMPLLFTGNDFARTDIAPA